MLSAPVNHLQIETSPVKKSEAEARSLARFHFGDPGRIANHLFCMNIK